MRRAVQHVIKRVNMTGHRSILVIPLPGRRSSILETIIEKAVEENIVVVTAAGKNWPSLVHNVRMHKYICT